MTYEEFCDVIKKFEIVPVEVPVTLSSKRLSEINEIFALFENIDKPGFVSVADLYFAIKCIGISPTEEEMEIVLKKEGSGAYSGNVWYNIFTKYCGGMPQTKVTAQTSNFETTQNLFIA